VEINDSMTRRTAQIVYFVLTACWFVFCWVGTLVSFSYHTDSPVEPQILEGIAIAVIPAVAGYLILFQLSRLLRACFRRHVALRSRPE
jgi:hypothetical protein